jgi:hypothetical protein
LRIRCINSIPEIVVAALLNRLKPTIAFVLDLMFRWSCSIRLFRYFEDRTFATSGSTPWALHQSPCRLAAALKLIRTSNLAQQGARVWSEIMSDIVIEQPVEVQADLNYLVPTRPPRVARCIGP